MRTIVLAAASLALTFVASAASAQSSLPGPAIDHDIRYTFPEVKERKLSNGIRVLFVERHDVPLVSVSVTSTVGAADAPPGVADLAARTAISSAYFSHSMRTHKKFNLIGASQSSESDYRLTRVATRAMASYLEDAVSELGEIVRVQFPDDDIVRVDRDLAIDALRTSESQSATFAARPLLYPEAHPYHYFPLGTVTALRTTDLAALRSFWKRAFASANVTIAASGDVSLERLIAALEATFADLPVGAAVAPSAPPAPALEPRKGIVVIDQPGTTQARVAVVTHGVPRRDPEYYALSLAMTILGNQLHDRIRQTYGTSYGVHSAVEAERGTPPLWVYGSVENGGVGTAIEEIMSAMAEIRAGKVPAAELEFNRLLAFHEIARSFETTLGTATLISAQAALGVSVPEFRALPERFRALTAQDVTKATDAHFDPARLRIIVCGDAKVLTPQLERLGLGPLEVRPAK